jgi:DNA-binding NtrC family response regulator
MPLELQSKLLLVVEHGIFRRVGGTRERSVQVRVIAASNQDLDQRVQAGAFRRDLLYRLNAFTVRIPPLRERAQDALRIADATLERLTRRYGRPGLAFTPSARGAIAAHGWPGNVRELVNAVQRAAMLCDGTAIGPSDLGLSAESPAPVGAVGAEPPIAGTPQAGALVFDFERGAYTAEVVEKALLKQALQWTKGNVSRAAKLIGMQRSSMRYRIERYQLEPYVTEVARK